jgi:hypothetical protein
MVVQDHPIAVISPNGGEVVHKPNLPVSWITNTALAGTSVSVELWNAAGLVRTLGTDADPSGIHTVTFDSTDIPDGQDYRIKVISGKNPQYTDMSDGPFEITSVHESVVYFTAQNDDTFGSGLGRYRDGTIDFVNQAANPEGIATDAAGNIYFCSVSEDKDWELMKYTTDGQTVDICHLWQQNGGWLSWAFDLAVNPKGEVYFDHYNGVGIGTGISKVDAQGQIQPVYTGIDPPTAMAFDRAGDLFFVTMADTTDRQYTLHKLTSAGQLTHYGVITKGRKAGPNGRSALRSRRPARFISIITTISNSAPASASGLPTARSRRSSSTRRPSASRSITRGRSISQGWIRSIVTG